MFTHIFFEMNAFTVLDLENWKRKSTYDFFQTFDVPFYNITANIDVSNLKKFCAKNQQSYFITALYLSQKTINQVENFRLRLANNQVRLYQTTQAGSTILLEDETFGFCYFPIENEMHEFIDKGKTAIANFKANPHFEARNGDLNMIYYSMIPWISFTSFQHARRHEDGDSVPRIVFGKYFKENGKWLMPISVEVHHALVDGLHVGQYFEILQKEIDRL